MEKCPRQFEAHRCRLELQNPVYKYYIHVTEPHISQGFERFMACQAKYGKDPGFQHSMTIEAPFS
jgi:hypothetical protein